MNVKFHNFISNVYFNGGINYWEINYIGTAKIGISKNKDHSRCFCDTQLGWGYFTKGQLRNGSNSYGKSYGVNDHID